MVCDMFNFNDCIRYVEKKAIGEILKLLFFNIYFLNIWCFPIVETKIKGLLAGTPWPLLCSIVTNWYLGFNNLVKIPKWIMLFSVYVPLYTLLLMLKYFYTSYTHYSDYYDNVSSIWLASTFVFPLWHMRKF